MNSLRSSGILAKNVPLLVVGRYSQYLVTLVSIPFLARHLGVTGLGLFALGSSATFVGSLLVDFGLTQVLAARYSQGRGTLLLRRSYRRLRYSIMSLLVVTLLLAIDVTDSRSAVVVLSGLLAGGLSSMGEDWQLIGAGRFGSLAGAQVVGRGLYLAALLLAIPARPEPEVALLAIALGNAAASILSALMSKRIGESLMANGGGDLSATSLARLGSPLVISRMMTLLSGPSSSLIYGNFVSKYSLGLFSAGDRMLRAAQSALDSIGLALLPTSAASRADDRKYWHRIFVAVVCCAALGFVAAIVAIALAPWLIPTVFGADFDSAIPIFRLECLILPATAASSSLTTLVLYVHEDRWGLLIGSAIALAVAVCGAVVLLDSNSTMEISLIAVLVEWTSMFWYVIRALRLRRATLSS
jgi:O-antigen/teichoic acid export membrane protein